MEKKEQVEARYEGLQRETDEALRQTVVRIRRISLLRVTLFAVGVAGVWLLFARGGWTLWTWVGVVVLLFLFLIKHHARLFACKRRLETRLRVYGDELSACRGDFSVFDGGDAFVDPSHDYTYDLDVFGRHSLFQLLNRTATDEGRRCLAAWLSHHATSIAALRERQERVQALALRPVFRERYRTEGLLCGTSSGLTEDGVRAWAAHPLRFVRHGACRVALWAVPALNILLICCASAGLLPGSLAGSVFCFFLLGSLLLQRRITSAQASYERLFHRFRTYSELLRAIDEELSDEPSLSPLCERLRMHDMPAYLAVKHLEKMLDVLDRRNNILVSAVLDGLCLWQLRQLLRLEEWKTAYGHRLPDWMAVAGEIDALCSLATYAYNHPEAVYAEWNETDYMFEAREMRHPLMDRQRCVPNDASLPACPYFVVVTGANMAGKSTYLRTLGVNYLLACVGAPVLCRSMRLRPAALVTSLRTTDSLEQGESYFFAELKRLERMLTRLAGGERLFIVLDEILKGTNSLDKQRGSLALVRRLMELSADGVIATHDVQLATLAERFPGRVHNVCFEADMKSDSLCFSYRMREGVAQNMNACFLMRRMGLEIEDGNGDLNECKKSNVC